MKKNTLPQIIVLLMVIFASIGCKKDTAVVEPAAINVQASAANLVAASVVNQPLTLTPVLVTNSALSRGQTFVFNLILKSGNAGASKVTIAIDDPIRGVCTSVTTNSLGVAQYSSYIAPSVTPAFYQYRFYVLNGPSMITTTAVYATNRGYLSTSLSVGLNTTPTPAVQPAQMCLAVRAQNIGQTADNSTVFLNASLGKDLLAEITSNPFSTSSLMVASISCPTTLVFPPAGGVCAASLEMSVATLSTAALKVVAKRLIQNSTNLSSAQKTACSTTVDFSTMLYSIATLQPDKGLLPLKLVDAAAITWDFRSVAGQFNISGNVLKTAYLTGVVTKGVNAGTICVMAIYKK